MTFPVLTAMTSLVPKTMIEEVALQLKWSFDTEQLVELKVSNQLRQL